MIPWFDGAIFSRGWKEALWDKFGMGAPRPRSQSELQIQRSQASILELSWELSINPKTVAKWRKQQTIKDPKTGSREPRSTVLSQAVKGMIVAFRRQTLLPLDDCLLPSANDPTSNTISPASVSVKAGHIALPQR